METNIRLVDQRAAEGLPDDRLIVHQQYHERAFARRWRGRRFEIL